MDRPGFIDGKMFVVGGAAAGLALVKEADDIKDGVTVAGGVKNVSSSSVSKKSLFIHDFRTSMAQRNQNHAP